MNEDRKAAIREVSEFVRRSAPPGAIEFAKTTEPFKTAIAQAQADAMDPTVHLKTTMKKYAGAFFSAFRIYCERSDAASPVDLKAMTLAELWHAGDRVAAIPMDSAAGRFSITPRTSAAPALQPSFSAAEISLLRTLGLSNDLMVEAGLIEPGASIEGVMRMIMTVKAVFPGALVLEIKDSLGDTHHLIPPVLQG